MSTEPIAAPITGSGQALYSRARRIIPGGTQLLSKRPELHLPELWPSYYARAKGVEIWDLDGRRLIDMSYSGIGACVLGYADPEVDGAVCGAIERGTMTTLNCPEEVELAELLLDLHQWADMVRFTRAGGEAMAVAVRLARAATGREKIAFCGYHGWHDWYLAANLGEADSLDGHLLPGLDPAGVPRGLRGTMLPFHYNRPDELATLVAEHGHELAAIVMEPVRGDEPTAGFLEGVRVFASSIGAALIFDEITAGWRRNTGGMHLHYGVTPDVAVFAKAIANGYPMGAVIGTTAVMEAAQLSFVSSTAWTERIGPTAALATIRKHRAADVGGHLVRIGALVQQGWRDLATCHGLEVHVGGIAPLGHLSFAYENGQAVRTLFTQLMLERGFLATGAFYASFAHQEAHVTAYLNAVDEVFRVLTAAIMGGTVEGRLRGPVAHSGFRRLT